MKVTMAPEQLKTCTKFGADVNHREIHSNQYLRTVCNVLRNLRGGALQECEDSAVKCKSLVDPSLDSFRDQRRARVLNLALRQLYWLRLLNTRSWPASAKADPALLYDLVS